VQVGEELIGLGHHRNTDPYQDNRQEERNGVLQNRQQ
jgi:hypothetical protein